MVIEDTAYIAFDLEREKKLLSLTWKQYPSSAIYRGTMDKVVELFKQHELHYYLTDQLQRGAILRDDMAWLLADWAPRMSDTTVLRGAIVVSTDFFNSFSLQHIVESVQHSFAVPIHFFHSVENARHWLLTGEHTPDAS